MSFCFEKTCVHNVHEHWTHLPQVPQSKLLPPSPPPPPPRPPGSQLTHHLTSFLCCLSSTHLLPLTTTTHFMKKPRTGPPSPRTAEAAPGGQPQSSSIVSSIVTLENVSLNTQTSPYSPSLLMHLCLQCIPRKIRWSVLYSAGKARGVWYTRAQLLLGIFG